MLTMIVDFFRFWYSTKPFQINIDIKTKKTLWKVTLKKERDMKNCINIIRRQESGTFLVTLPFPTPESFFAPFETVFREACNHYVT